jgi:radical SAM superfamily enzyme
MKGSYPDHDAADRAIDQGLKDFYKSNGGSTDEAELKRSVAALQNLYRRNVFPTMKVTWGSYPNQKGHITSNGCFRCHDDSHAAKDGTTISADCEYCHKQLE